MKIAIIGSGISGLGAAYLLATTHEITLYEKNASLGGHSRTIDIQTPNGVLPVDTGFIVFNKKNYPLLTNLFEHLQVPIEKSDMSFGVSIADGWLEYSSNAMFAQWENFIWRTHFCRMLRDIIRFNKRATRYLDAAPDVTLGQCLDELRVGKWFRHYYLQAMGAAIWSCSTETILKYPARVFIRFFQNHGLLTINRQPQWYTVTGGSREYIARLLAATPMTIKLNCGAVRIIRQDGKVMVQDAQGSMATYDHVILACHADQALALLDQSDAEEAAILSAFHFQDNHAVMHSDPSFMPKRRAVWASWVYLNDSRADHKPVVSLSYWMNKLQNLKTVMPVLVTLNPGRRPRPDLIHDEHIFSHPVFTVETLAAQEKLTKIQGRGNVWYAGAWQRYGFHEDGLLSAVNVAAALGVEAAVAIAPQLLLSKVMHKRLFPRENGFAYGIYYLAVPLTQIDGMQDGWRFGVDRFGLMSFFRRDHGPRDGSDLHTWIKKILHEQNLQDIDGDIVLVCMPRILGYVFNPVSFWLCHDRAGALRAILCEVNNTFSESHCYLCAHADGRAISTA